MSSRTAIIALTFLLATTVEGKELSLIEGGRRIIDRDPSSATSNCGGWVFAPSPLVDETGQVVAMYTTSDALANHCKNGLFADDRFGDRIRYHARDQDGSWTGGFDVVDRNSFSWMRDPAFLEAHPESFVGHLASPSVVKENGRYYMAFVGSVDDRNLCAGEHYAGGNICGSCLDPWSYFVVMWAVSEDGVKWRVRERSAGNALLIGRAPDAADRTAGSIYKGLTRVSLVTHDEGEKSYFYFGTQYWTHNGIKMAMFRMEMDSSSEWGTRGDPQLWSANRRQWVACPDGVMPQFITAQSEISAGGFNSALSSIARTTVLGQDTYIGLANHSPFAIGGRSKYSQVAYYISNNLVDWSGGYTIPSAIPLLADGYAYEVSVIDPVAVNAPEGGLRLFFASADGDEVNGVGRDGQHDCFLDPRAGPTVPYMGTGIYEATLQMIDRRPTITTLELPRSTVVAGESIRVVVRVSSSDGSTPQGFAVVEVPGVWRSAPLVNGIAEIDVPIRGDAGTREIHAYYSSDGIWDSSRTAPVTVNVVTRGKRRAAR